MPDLARATAALRRSWSRYRQERRSPLAARTGVPAKKLAEDNGWDNPLEDVKAGVKALIKREAKAALPGIPDSVWKKF